VTLGHIAVLSIGRSEDGRAHHGKWNLKTKSEKTNEYIAKALSVDLGAQLCIPVSFPRDGASKLSDGGSKNVTVNFLNGSTPAMLVSGNRASSATKRKLTAVLSLSALGPNHHQIDMRHETSFASSNRRGHEDGIEKLHGAAGTADINLFRNTIGAIEDVCAVAAAPHPQPRTSAT
jgi:hypothetical protein